MEAIAEVAATKPKAAYPVPASKDWRHLAELTEAAQKITALETALAEAQWEAEFERGVVDHWHQQYEFMAAAYQQALANATCTAFAAEENDRLRDEIDAKDAELAEAHVFIETQRDALASIKAYTNEQDKVIAGYREDVSALTRHYDNKAAFDQVKVGRVVYDLRRQIATLRTITFVAVGMAVAFGLLLLRGGL